MTDVIHVIVGGEQELHEVALGPQLLPKELRQPDRARASGVEVPTRLGRSGAPPPDEGPVALHDALELRHSTAQPRADAAGEAEVAGRHVEHREENLAVLRRCFRTEPLGK